MNPWIAGARPRTLPAAIAPVLVGTGVTAFGGTSLEVASVLLRALLALVVALALQVGVNYANDYSDGIRGTDAQRVGPVRLVGQELAAPGQVKAAAFASFGVAALAGVVLLALSGHWWLLLVGASAVAAAWFYTGGPRPYGYAGLGEAFVFVYFGLVAVVGTTYTQEGRALALAWSLAVCVGLLAVAILIANNLRDRAGDEVAGKHTLAVRLGDSATRGLYVGALMSPFVIATLIGVLGFAGVSGAPQWILLVMFATPAMLRLLGRVLDGVTGSALIPVLAGTGRVQLLWAVLATLGLLLS